MKLLTVTYPKALEMRDVHTCRQGYELTLVAYISIPVVARMIDRAQLTTVGLVRVLLQTRESHFTGQPMLRISREREIAL